MRSWLALTAVGVLYLLHFDFWLWQNPVIVFGLPADLLYQLGYCILVSLILFLLVRGTWVRDQDPDSPAPTEP